MLFLYFSFLCPHSVFPPATVPERCVAGELFRQCCLNPGIGFSLKRACCSARAEWSGQAASRPGLTSRGERYISTKVDRQSLGLAGPPQSAGTRVPASPLCCTYASAKCVVGTSFDMLFVLIFFFSFFGCKLLCSESNQNAQLNFKKSFYVVLYRLHAVLKLIFKWSFTFSP